ncbi:uncharacterized protein LOC116173668 isoform X2 [Photinus pyralis]|nr:uncharacterized protein LOC116173668 isoform X2 [Photinus pyralis]
MATKVPLNDAPPPYSTATAPIGFHLPENPQYTTSSSGNPPYPPVGSTPYPTEQGPMHPFPQPIGITSPSPLNAYPTHAVSAPLMQQQPTIAALNATPRYQSYRGFGWRNRKGGAVISIIVFVIFLIIFLIVFSTIFKKSSEFHKEFEETRQRQEE